MFSICIFRRYGIAVPILFFVVGLLLQRMIDGKHGGGYYINHVWTIGLNLFVTGALTGILTCFVDPPQTNGGYSYTSLSDLDLEDLKTDVQESLQHFVIDESEEDMFCYIPLNRCAMALMGVGVIMIGAGLMMD